MNRLPHDFLCRLQTLPPGLSMVITREMLRNVEGPLDRQGAKSLVEWIRSRLPFYCTVTPDLPESAATQWTFHRPDQQIKHKLAAIR